ncbi:hypothetical protein ACNSO8_22310 [Yersinia sp. LJYL362]|uniref:hypothetical protein n=1 Tax=Yersinia sp. LJYL362 TaxID=3402108 RepID=UPI003AB3D275
MKITDQEILTSIFHETAKKLPYFATNNYFGNRRGLGSTDAWSQRYATQICTAYRESALKLELSSTQSMIRIRELIAAHSSRSPYSVEFCAQQNAYVVICGYFAGGDWGFRLGSRGLAEYQVIYGYLSATSSRHRHHHFHKWKIDAPKNKIGHRIAAGNAHAELIFSLSSSLQEK